MYICDIAIIQYILYIIYSYYSSISEYSLLFAETWCPVASLGVHQPCTMAGDMEKHTVGLGMYYIWCIYIYIYWLNLSEWSPWQTLRNFKTSFWLEAPEFGSCFLRWGPLIVMVERGRLGVTPDVKFTGKHVMKCGTVWKCRTSLNYEWLVLMKFISHNHRETLYIICIVI